MSSNTFLGNFSVCSRLWSWKNRSKWFIYKKLRRGKVFSPPKSIICGTTFCYNYRCKSFVVCLTSFAHLETGIFANSSLKKTSSSFRLYGERLWTAVSRSFRRLDLCPDFDWAILTHAYTLKPFHHSPAFMFRIFVLLDGEPPPQSQIFCRL